MGVMDRYNESKKKRQDTSNNTTTNMGVMGRYEQAKIVNSIPSRIESFVTGINDIYNSFSSRFYDKDGNFINGYVGVSTSEYDDFSKKSKYYKSERDSLLKLLDQNADSFDSDWLSKAKTALGDESIFTNLSSMESAYQFYSAFDSEEEYDSWNSKETFIKAYLENADKAKTDYEYDYSWIKEADRRKEEDTVSKYDDFDHYSQIGANIENPSYAEAQGWLVIGNWRPFGDDIGNIVTFSRDNHEKVLHNALHNGQTVGDYRYAHMTDDEVAIYNYYLGKGEKDKADNYLKSLDEVLNQREGQGIAARTQEANLEWLMWGMVGLDQWASGVRNLDNFFTGEEADPISPMQYAGAEIREGIESDFWKGAWDLGVTVSNQLPSILVGTITGPVGGLATMGSSIVGNSYAEMRRLGYNEWQSRGYATLVTAAELGLQSVLGGFSSLGGKWSISNVAGNAINSVDNAIARVALKMGANALSEGIEEATQSVLEPIFKSIFTGEFEGIDWGEVAYSGLLGALSAGMLEGPSAIASDVKTTNAGKAIKEAGAVGKLTELGKGLDSIQSANSVAYKLAGKVDENTGAYTIGRLFNELGASLTEQNRAEIVKALEENGMRAEDASTIAKWLSKAVEGGYFSKKQIDALENNEIISKVFKEVIIDQNSTVNQRIAGYGEVADIIKNGGVAKNTTTAVDTTAENGSQATAEGGVENVSTQIPTSATGTEDASYDGKTTIFNTEGEVEEIKISEIASIKEGKLVLRLEDGRTVDAKEVTFGTRNEGLIYEAVADMAKNPKQSINAATANAMIKGYNPNEGISVGEYILGFKEAYTYGSYGFPSSEMSRDGFSSKLSDVQKHRAYELGKIDGKATANEAQKPIKEAKESVKPTQTSTKKKGKLHLGKISTKSLTERQNANIETLGFVADALGVDIHVFESMKGKDGKRIGANGWYDPKDNSIHIDLHAGNNGESVMLFTASHELTHFIREWSPAKFKVFADFLLEQYGQKGISVNELVQKQIEKARNNGREISWDTAYEEVIADSCEAMLTDSNAIEKLAKLKVKDKTLWDRIKTFITNLVAKIKAVYTGLNPNSVEANYVREMVDVAEQLQALWTDALVDAGESYSAISAEKTLAENGIVVNSDTNSASLMSVRDVLSDEQRAKVSTALASRFGVTKEEAMDWLKAETSMASLILNPKYSQYLDYTADPNEVAIKQNSDYPQGTVDFSPICAKRREFTSVMNNILRIFPNHVFAATDLAKIRNIMQEEGMTIPCGICYVEDRRQLDTIVAQNFIDSLKLYREGSKTRPDGQAFNTNQLKGLKLIDGDNYTPTVYELVSLEGLNVLKEKNPNMAEAWVKFNNARGMQSVRLLANEAEYKRQILKYSKSTVKSKNDKGGLRVYSFSDAEMFHLIDIIQVITDSATVGLSLQGYTKVNEYAKTVKDTGEKLNRSLIPKGELGYHIEKGKVILDYDTVEGIDINHPDFFDNKDNPNIGNITIGVSDVQIRAAMVSDFVDQIIPFHTGQSEEVLGEKGIATWSNYKDFQTEKDLATGKVSDHQVNIYTEVLQELEKEGKTITKRTFVEKYLQVCRDNNLTPRFSQFLNINENGEYVYTEGYHKMLVDFKTFAQTDVGEYLPQKPVKPIFDNQYITKILKDYVKSQKVKDAEISKSMPKVIERITNEIVKPNDVKLSDRDSDGNQLSKEQQEFFKDSKVRDENGNLMVVYHGTATGGFTVFGNSRSGEGYWFADKTTAESYIDVSSIGEEDWTGGLISLYTVYLNAKNPLVMDAKGNRASYMPTDGIPEINGGKFDHIDNIAYYAKEKGYDGLIVKNVKDYGLYTEENLGEVYDYNLPEGTVYVVFNPNQIKNTTNKTPTSDPDIRYSDRGYAPTFYSQMGKVVEGMKQDKFAANSVVPMLRGRGVKAEEIRWSGIVTFLEGKKSVTKQEVLEFIQGSQLQIGEQMSGGDIDLRYDASNRSYTLYDDYGQVVDTYNYSEFIGGYVSDFDEEIYSNAIELEDALREEYGGLSAPRWSQYKLDGGENYREIVFTMPNSTYTNRAMKGHWGQDAEGVLVHARIQDFDVDGKKMLFIEEIQSDWHNEGHAKGYSTKEYEDAVATHDDLYNKYKKLDLAFHKYVRSNDFRTDTEDVRKKKHDWLRGKVDTAQKKYLDAEKVVNSLKEKGAGDTPDAPFKDTYHEYVLKRLLRMAAEEGYDSIGWTIADTQSKRWSYDYEKAYRIEYDQDMPKFLSKYGRQWGAKVEKSKAPKGEEIWSMDLTDSMKDSVLNEGQVLYSDRVTDQKTLDFLNGQLKNGEVTKVYRAMQVQPVDENGNVIKASVMRVVSESPLMVEAKTFGKNGKIATYPAKLFSPMAGMVNGKWSKSINLNEWEETTFDLAHADTVIDKKTGKPKIDTDKKNASYGEIAYYYGLVKGGVDDNGKKLTDVPARYNPYIHTSLSALNDQFSSANKRPELVTVECIIPNSELTSGFRAEGAKDRVGAMKWHSGPTSSRLAKVGKARTVILTRYDMPVRVLPDSEVAKAVAEYIGDTENIAIQESTVTPSLSRELMNLGISVLNEEQWSQYSEDFPVKRFGKNKNTTSNIRYSERDPDSMSNRSLLANALESAAQNDIERNKLKLYKEKIDLINAEEKKLQELNKQYKDLWFVKGKRDYDKINEVEDERIMTANRINTYDKQLLSLEASKPLKNVLEREKKLAYKRAEQKGKEALSAYKERAAKTTRELMDRASESRKKGIENRHKTEIRHKIKKVVGELDSLLRHPTKEHNIKLGLQNAVIASIEAINLDTIDAEARIAEKQKELLKAKTPEKIAEIQHSIDFIRDQGESFKNKLNAMKEAYADIIRGEESKNYPQYFKDNATIIEMRIMSVVNAVGNTPLRNMSLSQLEQVYDLYKMVLTTIRGVNQLFVDGKTEELQENASAVMQEIESLKKLPEERGRFGEVIKSFTWNEMTPYYAFDRIGSKTLMKFFWDTIRGQDVYAKDVSESKDFASKTREKYGYKKWKLDNVHEFKLKDGRTFQVTLKHMLSIYAYSKREQALDHMSEGGFFFNDKSTFRKKGGVFELIKSNEEGYKIDADILKEIKDAMTSDQINYVDEMQDYLTNMGEKGNEVTRILWGIDIFKERYYFPLKSKDDFIKRSTETAQAVSLKNDGMTKETKPHASNPIVLEAFDEVWANHVERMSQYHAFVIPIDNLNKIHQYGTWAGTSAMSVSTMLSGRFGSAVNEYISQFIKDLNGNVVNVGAKNPIIGFLSKFKKTAVGASLSTVVQQPTAILRAMAVINPKYFVGKPNVKTLGTKWTELKKHAPIAIIKDIGGFDAGSGTQVSKWLNSDAVRGVDKVMDTIDDVAMKGAEIADKLGWVSIWEAVKREVKATTSLQEGSEDFLNKAGERFTEIIVKTQVYDSTLSRSGFMRSKSDMMKMLTAFMGEPTLSINMMFNAIINARRGGSKAQAARTISFTYASIIAASVMASLIYALRDDDEDESYLEKYMQAFGGEFISDVVLSPVTSLPAIKDIVSIFQGWDVERTDTAVFKDLKDALDGLFSENKNTYRKVEDFAGAIANFFGIPLKNVLRTGREIYNAFDDIFDGIKGGNIGGAFLEGAIGQLPFADKFIDADRSKSEKLYDAIISGDTTRIELYKSQYGEDGVLTVLRSEIKKRYLDGKLDYDTAVEYLQEYAGMDEDEIYWKMQEWEYESDNGDSEGYAKYNDFYEAVRTGKNLKTVIKEYTDNGVETKTLASQITSHFKPLYKEMTNYERASIKGYLLNAYALLGYDRAKKSKDIDKWLED